MIRGDGRLAYPLAVLVLVAAGASGCRQRTAAPGEDAGTDGGSDGPIPLTLDIAVTGCAAYDGAAASCSGAAPLVLSFSPVGSHEITGFKWTFGDGTPPSSERAPSHAYALPGRYDVTLIGRAGDSGFIQSKEPVHVVVEAGTAGVPCDVDAQCADGLACACAPGTGCPAPFVRGLCSTACDTVPCGPGATCAALALGPPSATGPAPRLPSCVAACQADPDCAPGFACRTLAAAGASSGQTWTRGCMPIGALADLGAPCRNANGILDDASCATGVCVDLGALGICSAACDAGKACPDGAACARFNDGRSLCLVECSATCALDPLLACSAPGTGFQLDAPLAATYCAPKACTSDTDCAPAGSCGAGSACVRR